MLEHLKSPNTKCFLTEILCPTLVYSKGLVGKPSPLGQNVSLSSVLSLLSQVEVEKAFRDSLMGDRVFRCFPLPANGEALLTLLKDASRDAENGPWRNRDAENGPCRASDIENGPCRVSDLRTVHAGHYPHDRQTSLNVHQSVRHMLLVHS